MIKAIIIDDEEHCIHRLKTLLIHHKSISIVGCFKSVEESLEGISYLQPDLLFLDVQINDKTGFDLLKQVKNIDFEVIFTTAFDKFAVQAFKFSAIDYLLKPVDPEDLKQALGKLTNKVSANEMKQKMEVLLNNVKQANNNTKKITIPTITGLLVIPVSDIIRCQSDINYTTIFLKDKQKLVVAKTLKEYEELLADYNFFRVHNSHLINLSYIKSYSKGKGGSATLVDGTEIEVSTRRRDDFLAKLSQL